MPVRRGIERIRKAANPESLPIGHLTRLDVCVNLKAAQALGIEIPPSIFARGQGYQVRFRTAASMRAFVIALG